ncbi:uncharacterized protein METZ01_LOCUS1947 [marine metagenome]|uniref:SGNH hydrolase-type esterase domain-containing protein n=1 Tax=marine metagenome TaxID=408172 RepID=A0A381N663_9ZZZZ
MNRVLLIFTFCILLNPILAQQQKTPIKILFVGNSFTFFWNMPQLVSAMAESQGVSINSYQSTVSGSSLEQHWKGEKGSLTRKKIDENNWDYVVLSDHSLKTIDAPEKFREYGKKFIDLVRSKGAEPIFMITWSYKDNPSMQKIISKEYIKLANDFNVKVFPVGPIWDAIRKDNSNIDLYFDNKHPSSAGSYLIALIITKSLTGKSLKDIPKRLFKIDEKGEKFYLSFVSSSNSKYLKEFVDKSIK